LGDCLAHGLSAAHLDRLADRNAGCCESGVEGLARARAFLAHHELVALKVVQRQLGAAGQQVSDRGEHDERLTAIGHAVDARIVHRVQQQTEVVLLIEHPRGHGARIADCHCHSHLGVGLAKPSHHRRDVVGPDGTQLEHALVAAARAQQQRGCLLLAAEDAVGHFPQHRAEAGELDAAATPVEQFHAVVPLQAGDMGRHGGLAQTEQLGRRRHAAAAGGCIERPQLRG
jgi:hypothetical protein